MIRSESVSKNQVNADKVKVAIIDSGINYSDDIEVCERKNFIPDEDDMSILYEDFSGHGTSIAGIIAAKDNEDGVTGINPNVELYSARVLDAKNEAPVSRIVEAIEWAIEKKVNIINLSFVTATDSTDLRFAIDKAYNAGILIIASAGNRNKVEYPAAYEHVMAVGSVDSNGEISDFSPDEGQSEIVAPGELITSTDVFDTLSVHSGTSFAAAHITGAASLLWQQDLNASNDFIRCVLDISANLYGNSENYGYGLVDCDYANKVFKIMKPLARCKNVFRSLIEYGISVREICNRNAVYTYNEIDSVEGAWLDGEHEGSIGNFAFNNEPNGRNYILAGCTLSDRSQITALNGTGSHPYFHGYWYYGSDTTDERNYIASYIYLTQIASALVHSESIPAVPTLCKAGNANNTSDYKDSLQYMNSSGQTTSIINNVYINRRDNIKWTDIASTIKESYVSGYTGNSIQKGLIVYGIAIHHVGDLFAHSSAIPQPNTYGVRITHPNGADDPNTVPQRYQAAKKVINNTLGHLDKTASKKSGIGSLKDFSVDTDYRNYFYIRKFKRFVNQIVSSNEYSENYLANYNYFVDPYEDPARAGLHVIS